jgi:DNA-binding NtrC family response regulator
MTAVLIVEDDPLIAWSLSQTISDEVGADVIVATNLVGAEEHLADNLDFALLDVNIGDGTTFALARRLAERGVPFAFASGSSRSVVPPDLMAAPFLSKPCRTGLVSKTIRGALASTPLPSKRQL